MLQLPPTDLEPLAVAPRDACGLLGISNTRLYHILGTGELESYHDGRSRRIPLAAIRKYIAKRLAASTGRRGRGRPPGSKNKPWPAERAAARAVAEQLVEGKA
jgi:excisionase family DNA binding protein